MPALAAALVEQRWTRAERAALAAHLRWGRPARAFLCWLLGVRTADCGSPAAVGRAVRSAARRRPGVARLAQAAAARLLR